MYFIEKNPFVVVSLFQQKKSQQIGAYFSISNNFLIRFPNNFFHLFQRLLLIFRFPDIRGEMNIPYKIAYEKKERTNITRRFQQIITSKLCETGQRYKEIKRRRGIKEINYGTKNWKIEWNQHIDRN